MVIILYMIFWIHFFIRISWKLIRNNIQGQLCQAAGSTPLSRSAFDSGKLIQSFISNENQVEDHLHTGWRRPQLGSNKALFAWSARLGRRELAVDSPSDIWVLFRKLLHKIITLILTYFHKIIVPDLMGCLGARAPNTILTWYFSLNVTPIVYEDNWKSEQARINQNVCIGTSLI